MNEQKLSRWRLKSLLKAASSKRTPSDQLLALARDQNPSVRNAAVNQYWDRKLGSSDVSRRLHAAKSPGTPAKDLALLLDDVDPDVRNSVPSTIEQLTQPESLRVLAQVQSLNARSSVAGNVSTPAEALQKLASDPEAGVRGAVASNGTTPDEAIQALTRDSDDSVRSAASAESARRRAAKMVESIHDQFSFHEHYEIKRWLSRLTPEELVEITKIEDSSINYIRQHIAENATTPPEALGYLAKNERFKDQRDDGHLRRAVASHPHVPTHVLMDLANENDDSLPRAAIDNLKVREDINADEFSLLAKSPSVQLRSAVAENPTIPSSTFRVLCADSSPQVRASAARSVKAPVDCLAILADDSDSAVQQAALTAFGTEQCYEDDGHGDSNLRWWYKREFNAKELSIMAAVHNSAVRALVAQRLSISDETLDTLMRDPTPTVRRTAIRHRRASIEHLVALADDPDEEVQGAVVDRIYDTLEQWPAAPLKLRNLAESFGIGLGIWQSPKHMNERSGLRDFSPFELARLAAVHNPLVRSIVAQKRSISEGTLAALLADPESTVRESAMTNNGNAAESIAKKDDTSVEALLGFARSKSDSVRCAVAGNTRSSATLVANLVRDDSAGVRQAVAGNPNTAPEALGILARDAEPAVRKAVALNANTATETLGTLGGIDDLTVALALTQNPKCPAHALVNVLRVHAIGTRSQAIREAIASHANVPPEVLVQLADSPDVAAVVAGNSRTPAQVLRHLAYSRITAVRRGVASNPSTPSETLEILALDENPGVREIAGSRANGSPEVP